MAKINTKAQKRPRTKTYHCKRCEHQWESKKFLGTDKASGQVDNKPRICPKCKSPLWMKAKAKAKESKEPARIKSSAGAAKKGKVKAGREVSQST